MLRHDAHMRTHGFSAVAKWITSIAVAHHARLERAAALAGGMWDNLRRFSVK
jgi:hypothetical protein